MAFVRNDNLGVFSPISDASSTDLQNRTGHSEDAKFSAGALARNLPRNSQPASAMASVMRTDKPLMPPSFRRPAVNEDTSNKRRSFAEMKNGVFSPLRESDDDSVISPQFASRPPSTRPAITSTPIIPFSIPMSELLASSHPITIGPSAAVSLASGSSISTRPPTSRAATFTPSVGNSAENGHRRRSENGVGTVAMSNSTGYPKYVGISKATQTTTDLTSQPATTATGSSSAAQNIQTDFIRNVVEESLDEFKLVWRADCYSFYAKLLQIFSESEQRVEDTIGTERLDYMRRLVDENERLRAENDRLKAMQFGKFF